MLVWIQEIAGEGVSVSLSLFVEDSWRKNRRIHFVKCILVKEGFLFTRERQRFAKVFLKKRQRFAKVFKYSEEVFKLFR